MADLVVGMAKSVVDGALTKAQAAIEEEGKLRESAACNLVFITGEFQMIQSFLKVADSDRLENPVGRTWVRQTRDLAYDVEDCIEFVVHLDKKNRWWLQLLKPLASCVEIAPLPLDVAVHELDRLKARVEDVSNRNTRYSLMVMGDSGAGVKPSATATTNDQEHQEAAAPPSAAFNRLFEAASKTTHKGRLWDLSQLLTKKDQDLGLGVISIWSTSAAGVGGGDPGMASIAWNAYTNRETCENFACRAWALGEADASFRSAGVHLNFDGTVLRKFTMQRGRSTSRGCASPNEDGDSARWRRSVTDPGGGERWPGHPHGSAPPDDMQQGLVYSLSLI